MPALVGFNRPNEGMQLEPRVIILLSTLKINQENIFLDASMHLYKRLRPSVGPSVGPSVRPSVRRYVRPLRKC